MNEIVTLIERVGFPIVLVLIVIFLFKDTVSNYFKTILEEQKKDKQALLEELKFNREVSAKLLSTNELLCKDVVNKMNVLEGNVEDIASKLDNLIDLRLRK